MAKRIGKYTLQTDALPSVLGYASVVGKKEGEGPLSEYFDIVEEDTTFGEETWEKAEEIGRARVGKECRSRWSLYH